LTQDVESAGLLGRNLRRRFRHAVVLIYLATLPAVMLVTATWVHASRNWLVGVGGAALFALVIWRLWLHLKATGRAGNFPSPRRFWLVFAPLGILAAAGLCLIALGAGVAILGASMWNREPTFAGESLAFAALVLSAGVGTCRPFVRLLLRKPSTTVPQAEPAAPDGG